MGNYAKNPVTPVLTSPPEVVRCLVAYADHWQPGSGSIIQVAWAKRPNGFFDGLRPALLDRLDERAELCRRLQLIPERDRDLLFLWYVKQLTVDDIARAIRISRRQCFRRRAQAIKRIVRLGEPDEAVQSAAS